MLDTLIMIIFFMLAGAVGILDLAKLKIITVNENTNIMFPTLVMILMLALHFLVKVVIT